RPTVRFGLSPSEPVTWSAAPCGLVLPGGVVSLTAPARRPYRATSSDAKPRGPASNAHIGPGRERIKSGDSDLEDFCDRPCRGRIGRMGPIGPVNTARGGPGGQGADGAGSVRVTLGVAEPADWKRWPVA